MMMMMMMMMMKMLTMAVAATVIFIFVVIVDVARGAVREILARMSKISVGRWRDVGTNDDDDDWRVVVGSRLRLACGGHDELRRVAVGSRESVAGR